MAKLRICNRRHTSESVPSSNAVLRRRLHHVPRSLARLRYCARLCYTCCMPDFAPPVARLIDGLTHLPGIAQNTPHRLAFYPLPSPPPLPLPSPPPLPTTHDD